MQRRYVCFILIISLKFAYTGPMYEMMYVKH